MTQLSKEFFTRIETLQQALLVLSFIILVTLPLMLAYGSFGQSLYQYFFGLSLWSAFFVLAIRPLADLLPQVSWVRPLVILRKGFGTFSASFIVAILISKSIVDGGGYLLHFLESDTWSLANWKILSTSADISAVLLLITSNKFSKRILRENWKRIQKLAYVYFYAGALYEYVMFHSISALVMVCVVATLTISAFLFKRRASLFALV